MTSSSHFPCRIQTNQQHHAFVRVPKTVAQVYANTGASALRLVWQDRHSGETCDVVVSFGGQVSTEADTIHVPYALAVCLGLSDGVVVDVMMARGDGVINGPVYVEPASVDDWEILQLNAGDVETNMLEQITAITCKHKFPFWIQSSGTLIHLRLVSTSPYGWCRLSPQTEVAVAPMLRKRTDQQQQQQPHERRQGRKRFRWRVQATPIDSSQNPLIEWPARVIFMDPHTYAAVSEQWHDDHHPPLVCLHAQAAAATATDSDKGGDMSDVLMAVSSPVCELNQVMIPSLLCSEMNICVGDVVFAHIAPHPPPPLQQSRQLQLRAHRVQWQQQQSHLSSSSSSSSPVSDWSNMDVEWALEVWLNVFRDAAVHQLSHPEEASKYAFHAPLKVGSIVELRHPQTRQVAHFCLYRSSDADPNTETATTTTMEEKEERGRGDGGRKQQKHHQHHLSFLCRVNPKPSRLLTTRNQQQQQSSAGATGVNHRMFAVSLGTTPCIRRRNHHQSNHLLDQILDAHDLTTPSSSPLQCLAGVDECVRAIDEHVRPRLRRQWLQHLLSRGVRLSGHGGSSLVVAGANGCGKTSVMASIAWQCRQDVSLCAHIEWIQCGEWMNESADDIIHMVERVLQRAHFHAPSLLVFDDLDRLVPQATAGEQPTPMTLRNAVVAERLADLLLAAQECALPHAIPVAFMASARSFANIHDALRATGLFVESVTIPSPQLEQRVVILQTLVRRYQHKHTGSDYASAEEEEVKNNGDDDKYRELALNTEGYVCRDLQQVVARAIHFNHDFTRAMDGFVPAALKGLSLVSSATKWDDIGGLHSVRQMIKETFDLPARFAPLFEKLPIKLRCGLLLYGPPGCGKTMVASAVAGECALNFISVKGPELLNKYIGASEENVRAVFDRAAAAAPCILFFDEFESIAPKRGGESTGVTDRVVNQLLTQLDGVEARQGVYILAASSRPDLIDPALLRPGRLDKSLYCNYPSVSERLEILHALTRNVELSDDARAYLSHVAEMTEHYSGADLQGIVTTAQVTNVHEWINAAKKQHEEDDDDVEENKQGNAAAAGAAAGGAGGGDGDGVAAMGAVQRQHLEQALRASSPSTSATDRRMFESVYARFVQSRDNSQSSAFDPHGKQRIIAA